MKKIGLFDLKILSMGIRNERRIDEKMLSNEFPNAGTGRIMDSLASLIERGLLIVGLDKSFQVTDAAVQILWTDTSLHTKIQQILDIAPMTIYDVARYLDESQDKVSKEMNELRKKHIVVMSAIRKEDQLLQTFELLETRDGPEEKPAKDNTMPSNVEILQMLSEIMEKVNFSRMEPYLKKEIGDRMEAVKARLGV